MKEVTSKTGEVEMQTPEHVPDGPVRMAPTAPDERAMVNPDGTPSTKTPERPVYAPPPHPGDAYLRDLGARIEALEAQIKSLQMSMPKGIVAAPTAPGIAKAK